MGLADHLGILKPRLDFGVRALAPEWRRIASPRDLARDVDQGLVLAASTLPLALLLAMLSGAPASSGIISAGVASAICVMFGGTRVALSGPGLASTIVVSGVLAQHGVRGLGFVLILTGALQLVTGLLGLGRFVRLAPLAVVRGAVVGLGALILFAQLPHAFGATIDPHASTLARLDRLGALIPSVDPVVLAIGLGSVLFAALGLLHRRVPGALLGIVVAAACVAWLGLEVPPLHETTQFPWPSVPNVPSTGLAQLLGSAVELFFTATLATAINTAATEQLGTQRTDTDQELIGTGLATVALAFLHGLPATQLVARSAIAIRDGVETRRPALVQAVVVIGVGLAAWPVLHLVPAAALTGIAAAVALPLLDPRPLRDLGRVAGVELGVGLATVVVMVFGGFVLGIVVGVAISFALASFRLARTRAMLHPSNDATGPHQLTFSGPITFLAALEMERLRAGLRALDTSHGLVVDLRSVISIDGTGAAALVSALDEVRARHGKIALLGPSMLVRERLQRADEQTRHAPGVEPGTLLDSLARNDREVDVIIGKPRTFVARPQLLAGVERFRDAMREHYDSLFAQLADGQHPHTLFITCADSRIDPALLMGSHPGDLFIVRTLGALISPFGTTAMPQEGAALEYGVGVLGVRNVVVCGHSKCGAISALKKGPVPEELATLGVWSKHAHEIAGEVSSFRTPDDAGRAVTVRQLENLLSYPIVREKRASGELQLHAWFYDLGAVELYEWAEARKRYVVLGHDVHASEPPPAPSPTEDDDELADDEEREGPEEALALAEIAEGPEDARPQDDAEPQDAEATAPDPASPAE